MPNSIRDTVAGPAGFSTTLSLTSDELEKVKSSIEKHWLDRLQIAAPDKVNVFAERGIERYHENAHLVDHSSLWPKSARILSADSVREIRRTSLMKRLVDEYGEFEISDEDDFGWEEMYWRLVRPHEPTDVGPLHADCWFWELGKMKTPANTERVKVWIAIVCERGRNDLHVVPQSHQCDWKWHGRITFRSVETTTR